MSWIQSPSPPFPEAWSCHIPSLRLLFSQGGLNGPIIVHILLPPAWTPKCHLPPQRPGTYAWHTCFVTCCFTWSPNTGRFSMPYSCWFSECVCQFQPLLPIPFHEETHQKPVAYSALGSVVATSHPLLMEFVPHTCQRSITSPILGGGGRGEETYRSNMMWPMSHSNHSYRLLSISLC